MASRQDQVIDDDEPDTCPLCIEELDLSDRGFRPCPCGYQICQFCYNNIKTTMNGLCPACRRPYDDKNIKFDAPSAEDVARHKENKSQIDRKRAAAKRQEAASRQADTLSRKHLAGIRVRRQNLVYVTGLRLNTSDPLLSEKLRGDQYFGQYGKIDKIVVNRPKDSRALQPVGVYITYFEKSAAALCISMVNGTSNAGGTVRADFGTTKYCSAFLRHETCSNKNCTFLHEVGEDNESFTREGLSSLNASGTQSSTSQILAPVAQASHQPIPASYELPLASQPIERSDSRSDGASAVDTSDRPALPSHASWAQRNASSRRPSQTHSFASASPMTTSSIPVSKADELASPDVDTTLTPEATRNSLPQESSPVHQETSPTESRIVDHDLTAIKQALAFEIPKFVLDESSMSKEDLNILRYLPLLFDPEGGTRRYANRRRELERVRLEKDQQVASQALSVMDLDNQTAAGSLQLGGEPEERHELDLEHRQTLTIQPPGTERLGSNFDHAHTRSPVSQAQSSLDGNSSALPPSFALSSFKSASPSLHPHKSTSTQPTQNPHASHYGGIGHVRQSSRFSFANDSAQSTKSSSSAKFSSQQPGGSSQSNHFSSSQQQGSSGSQTFSSGVQGPPPGLKTTGTPPVSGGGMFGQGHGFATSGLNYGVNSTNRNANDEMMHELMRNRGGSAGSGQASEGGRREFLFPSLHHPSPPQNPGLSSFPYGSHPATYQDHGPQKQKKKGKKHRHANTSSSGGGVVDLVDPNLLRSRMHQTSGASQSHYGAQGQGQGGLSTMYGGNSYGRW